MVGGEATASGAASPEDRLEAPANPAPSFGHYRLLTDEDGKPIELGRSAMGITYKAFDIDLQCPVTLKVISKEYLGDESAQLRFLREARAAASLRHPNIASVFHLGKSGGNYFYAMEFVEAQVMYQHLHAPAPIEQLKGVPQPVVVLLEALVEKDPGRRFQSPAERLKAIPR